jgi:putative transcriptional regulator
VHVVNFYGLSDKAILKEIGRRLKRKRLDQNLTQKSLAGRTGLNRSTISEAENGVSVSLQTLIQILRGLHVLDQIDAFLPDPGLSPLQLAKLKGRERQRASGSISQTEQESSDW